MSVSKITGYLFVLAGCSGLGLWYSVQMKLRIKYIKEMIRILNLVLSEMDYGHATLPEICEILRGKAAYPYGDFFTQICGNICREEGRDFGKISNEILCSGMKRLPLEEEREVFVRCFTDVGYADGWLQRAHVDRGKKELQIILDTEEKEWKKKSKMAVSLGTMSGILLVLILL